MPNLWLQFLETIKAQGPACLYINVKHLVTIISLRNEVKAVVEFHYRGMINTVSIRVAPSRKQSIDCGKQCNKPIIGLDFHEKPML